MQRLSSLAKFVYRHHFIRYLFVGGSTFIIDFGTLVMLHGVLDVHLAVATTIAYWLSITYNFTLNRSWTFSSSEQESLHRHAVMYGVLLGFNYLFTLIFVGLASRYMHFGLAKTLAVIIQVSWTYQIYKKVVFK